MQNDKTTYKSCFGSLCIAEKRHNNAFRGFGFVILLRIFLNRIGSAYTRINTGLFELFTFLK